MLHFSTLAKLQKVILGVKKSGVAYRHIALGRVGSGHGSLISYKMWVVSGLVSFCGSGPKKLTRVQLWGNSAMYVEANE